MFYRKKLAERFQRECLQSEANIIHMSGLPHSGKSSFAQSLIENGILESSTTKFIEINDSVVGEIDTPKGFNIFISNIREFTSGKFSIVFDNGEYIPGIFDIIENYIDSTGDNDTRFIVLSSLPETETILSMEKITFRVLPFSFKEFMENRGKSVELIALKNNPKVIPSFLPLLEEYMSIGGYPEVVEASNENREGIIMRIFEDTKNDILAKVKTRDHAVFLKFIQVLATQTWELLKIDKLSQITDVPRRTIDRFVEILESSGIIITIDPFVRNKEKETSIHKKFYFSDLSFLRAILGPYALHSTDRARVYENFIFLELYRNLYPVHTIYFYRKKSQASISFILEHNGNGALTPIDVSERSSDATPQAFLSFEADYGAEVNRYIVFNGSKLTEKELGEKKIYILPYIAV